ncbi:MAG: TlpA family protein disulfide reductase [Bacteroidales bacterium]|jgi:thiol-disulfide isomerase/thioredoxin|nr:TlpA family protein disulfide reductase [Bacteroidales bacterium]
MKKNLVVILTVILFVSCGTKKYNENDTVLNGEIKNSRIKNVFITYEGVTDTVVLDKKGRFTYITELSKPVYVLLKNGNNSTSVYLSPKSKTNIKFDSKKLNETLKFSGTDGDINVYLREQSQLMDNSEIASDKFLRAPAYEIFDNSLNNLMNGLNNRLDEFAAKTKGKYADFINIENQRLNVIKSYLILSFYIPQINANTIDERIENEIDNSVKNIEIDNPDVYGLQEFISFAQPYVMYKLYKKFDKNSPEYESIDEYANAYFITIDELYKSNEIKENLYYIYINEFLSYYGIESVKDAYQKYKEISENEERLAYLESIFFENTKLDPGNPSVDFSFPDINGKVYRLSDFRGKYVYIDVWASWCGPCRAEFPHLKALKEKFKTKNLAVIGISVDEEKEKWENMIRSQKLDGIQLYAGGWNNPLCDFYEITGIPRFILIDMEGNIINANADRPSGKIETILNSLNGI